MRLLFIVTEVYLPSVVELLFLLGNLAVNLLPHLAKLQGGPQHLVLLCLQRAFGLLQALLQLLLLSLKPPPLFVQFVNGASTVSELVQQILDFVGEVLRISSVNLDQRKQIYHLVLPPDNVQLLIGLL